VIEQPFFPLARHHMGLLPGHLPLLLMHARPNRSLATAQHRNHALSLLAGHETESFGDALTLSRDQSIEVDVTAHSRAGGGVHAREHSAGITVSDHHAV